MNSQTSIMLSDSAKAWNTSIIAGTGLFQLYEEPPSLYRDMYRGEARNYFNAALYINTDGERSRYNKNNLVPIVERFPFVEFFNTIDVFGWLNWGKIAGFGKGLEPMTVGGEILADIISILRTHDCVPLSLIVGLLEVQIMAFLEL